MILGRYAHFSYGAGTFYVEGVGRIVAVDSVGVVLQFLNDDGKTLGNELGPVRWSAPNFFFALLPSEFNPAVGDRVIPRRA